MTTAQNRLFAALSRAFHTAKPRAVKFAWRKPLDVPRFLSRFDAIQHKQLLRLAAQSAKDTPRKLRAIAVFEKRSRRVKLLVK